VKPATRVQDHPMSESNGPPLRKRLLAEGRSVAAAEGALDIAACATIGYSSEDPAHPIENLLDDQCGPGGTYWAGASYNTTERLVVEFDEPQSISRLVYEVEETQLARTQELRVEVSGDAGKTYRQVLVQEYAFSPQGATLQREDMRLNVDSVNRLRLTIVPNKNGTGKATLTSLRLFA
jgi:F5/8 type C domain